MSARPHLRATHTCARADAENYSQAAPRRAVPRSRSKRPDAALAGPWPSCPSTDRAEKRSSRAPGRRSGRPVLLPRLSIGRAQSRKVQESSPQRPRDLRTVPCSPRTAPSVFSRSLLAAQISAQAHLSPRGNVPAHVRPRADTCPRGHVPARIRPHADTWSLNQSRGRATAAGSRDLGLLHCSEPFAKHALRRASPKTRGKS